MKINRPGGRRHVLLLPSWYPSIRSPVGGTFFRSQAMALRDAGIKAGVISPEILGLRAYLKAGRPTTAIVREDDDGIPTYRRLAVPLLPRFSRRNALLWLRAGESLFTAYVRDHGMPDLLHAHSALYAGILAHRLTEGTGLPYIITEHHSAFARGRVRRWTLDSARRAFASASARVVVSRHLRLPLVAQFTDGFCPWQTIPNVLERLFEQPLQREPRDPDKFQFACIGAFRTVKAQDKLIAAFAVAFRGDESVRLRFGGEGSTEPACRALAEELGVAAQIDFLGCLRRDEVWRELMSTDAFVVPSYYETFGVAAIEALACGVPVVATQCGGLESIVDESNGLLVPPGDVNALAGALSRMKDQRSLYHSETLRQDCLDRYSNEVIAGQLTDLYESTLTVAASSRVRTAPVPHGRPLDSTKSSAG